MKLISGKNEIVYLLTKAIEKYEAQTGERINRNTNRRNYEGVAKRLSEISNELPQTASRLDHDFYPPDYNPQKLEYPFRKYDITGNQVKDAYYNQIVANPRPFLVDACYIYLYGVGRKGFEKDPQDTNLLEAPDHVPGIEHQRTEEVQTPPLLLAPEPKASLASSNLLNWLQRKALVIHLVLIAALVSTIVGWLSVRKEWATIKRDMNLLPYQPTKTEIDSLEGVWLCYTGSPQARSSDPNRYHMVVSNVVDVKYKEGYFVFARYGASFDHIGYMQYEAPWLVSIHSYVKNADSIESPRHSLMRLDQAGGLVSVISASWNFDVGSRNNIIGIREVYIKQGKGGKIDEVLNTIENASCRCKIVRWRAGGKQIKTFYLRNELLDHLANDTLKSLIDEKSILLRIPQSGLIYTSDTIGRKPQ
ncbi:MAG: hypothetical protein INR73_16040 [Williamsia sp.]|nr:hypothetical protein [Williamsia sp.]